MDWAGLSSDLLCLIAKKVYDFVDFIRLRAVCRHWRSALHPSDLRPQLPCFVLLRQCENKHQFDIKLFSLYSNKTYSLPSFLQPKPSYLLYSLTLGYLCASVDSPLERLFNPITGVQVPLPNFGGHCCCCTISIHPSGDVMHRMCHRHLPRTTSMWRYSGRNWTRIFEVPNKIRQTKMVSYCNGRLYTVDMIDSVTAVIDVATGDKVSVIKHPSVMFQYLIDACGDLLGVQTCKLPNLKTQFQIYRLEDATRNCPPRWAKLNGGIGDRILFLDDFQKTGFCLKASEFHGIRSSCIYLKHYRMKEDGRLMCLFTRYDLDEHKSNASAGQELELDLTASWFVPTLY